MTTDPPPDDRSAPRVPDTPDSQARDAEPVLPEVATEDRDAAWGDDRDARRDEEWYRRERPPHHE